MNARTYGQVIGVVLLALGVAGLLIGDQLFGLLNIEIVEDIVHLALGAVLAYVGFGMRDNATGKMIAMVIGVTLLLVGVLGFVTPSLFGLLPKFGYTIVDNVVHLVLGALGVYVGRMASTDTVVRA